MPIPSSRGKRPPTSDLKAGDHVLAVTHEGSLRMPERPGQDRAPRPLLLVEAEAGEVKASLVLQNAETVRLVGEDGMAGLGGCACPRGSYSREGAPGRQALWDCGQERIIEKYASSCRNHWRDGEDGAALCRGFFAGRARGAGLRAGVPLIVP